MAGRFRMAERRRKLAERRAKRNSPRRTNERIGRGPPPGQFKAYHGSEPLAELSPRERVLRMIFEARIIDGPHARRLLAEERGGSQRVLTGSFDSQMGRRQPSL